MSKIKSFSIRALILCLAALVLPLRSSAQSMNKQCKDKRCVAWGGGASCSTHLECDPARLKVEVVGENPVREIAAQSELDFGKLLPGQGTAKKIKITNIGRAPLTVTVPFVKVGDTFTVSDVPGANFTLNQNDNRTFTITYQTNNRGLQFGGLSILTNDPSVADGRFNIWLKAETLNRDVGYFKDDGSPWGNVTSISDEEVKALYGANPPPYYQGLNATVLGYCYTGNGDKSEGAVTTFVMGYNKGCVCHEGSRMVRNMHITQGPFGEFGYSTIYCLKTTVPSGDQAPVTNDLLLIVNDKVIPRKVPFEIDIGSYIPKKTPEVLTFWLKNNSAQPQVIDRLLTGGGLRVDSTTLKKTLAPGEMSSFKVSLDTSKVGVKSSSFNLYRTGEAQPYYSLKLGGIVWTDTLEALEKTVATPTPSASPSSASASGGWGGDIAQLLRLKTRPDFEKAILALPMTTPERLLREELLRTPENRIFALYLSASKRGVLSLGARAAADAARIEIEKQNANDVIARFSQIFHTIKNDPSGLVRYELISMLSTLKYLNSPLRTYAQLILSNSLIDKMVATNSLGRFYLRAGFLKTYLATSPPLKESTPLIQAVLKGMRDPIQQGIIIDNWVAQYPELYAAARGQ